MGNKTVSGSTRCGSSKITKLQQNLEANLAELHYIIFMLGDFLMPQKTSHRRSHHSVRFRIRGSGP